MKKRAKLRKKAAHKAPKLLPDKRSSHTVRYHLAPPLSECRWPWLLCAAAAGALFWLERVFLQEHLGLSPCLACLHLRLDLLLLCSGCLLGGLFYAARGIAYGIALCGAVMAVIHLHFPAGEGFWFALPLSQIAPQTFSSELFALGSKALLEQHLRLFAKAYAASIYAMVFVLAVCYLGYARRHEIAGKIALIVFCLLFFGGDLVKHSL